MRTQWSSYLFDSAFVSCTMLFISSCDGILYTCRNKNKSQVIFSMEMRWILPLKNRWPDFLLISSFRFNQCIFLVMIFNFYIVFLALLFISTDYNENKKNYISNNLSSKYVEKYFKQSLFFRKTQLKIWKRNHSFHKWPTKTKKRSKNVLRHIHYPSEWKW